MNPFDDIDAARIARHQQLLELWHALPAEEIIADLVVGVQAVAFKTRQARVVAAAQIQVAHGATHECSEWYEAGVCQVCGRVLVDDRR